jgi:SAM-dependent methyltransferase
VGLGRPVFDDVAEIYDRARPRYPGALFDDLISLARLPESGSILEVGCGTGQATLGLAGRGYRLVCLEPGPRLAAIARRNLAGDPDVSVVEQPFESWDVEPATFDLVVAARALHWISPAVRFTKAARILRRGGSLAVITTSPVTHDTPLMRAIQSAYARLAPSLALRSGEVDQELQEGFAESGLFRVLPARHHRWSRLYSDDEYVDLLRTHSSHIVLSSSARSALLSAVGETIAAHGGSVEVEYDERLLVGSVAVETPSDANARAGP